MNDCIFCRIASKEIVVPFFQENLGAILINDKNPVAKKHVLVISKAHIADMSSAITGEFQYVDAVLRLARAYAAENLPGGYRIVINTGDDAGQTVKHFHCHVLGGEKLKDL